jgi:hypothetical protein
VADTRKQSESISAQSTMRPGMSTEILRRVEEAQHRLEPAAGEEKLSLFWRVFGGTILSITALVAITLYQQLTGSIADLRSTLSHLSENQAEMIKKDDAQNRFNTVWSSLRDVETSLPALKTSLQQVESRLQSADAERKEQCQNLLTLHEKVAVLEAQAAAAKK